MKRRARGLRALEVDVLRFACCDMGLTAALAALRGVSKFASPWRAAGLGAFSPPCLSVTGALLAMVAGMPLHEVGTCFLACLRQASLAMLVASTLLHDTVRVWNV